MKKPNAVTTEYSVERLEKALFLRIIREDFRAGDILPSKERLAETYGVGTHTVTAAVGRLVARGLLIRAPGVGIVVGELLQTCEIDVLIRLMDSSGDDRALELEVQLLDLLALNCREVVRRAAACRTEEHLTWFRHYLRRLIDRIELGAHVDYVADAHFQLLRVLAAASGCVAFTVLLNSFRHYLRGAGGIQLFSPEAWRQLEHALESKDADRCQQIVQRCFELRIEKVLDLLSRSGGADNEGGVSPVSSPQPAPAAASEEPSMIVSEDSTDTI
jgi:DNA-binding FadR family transcriptional regulator